MNDYTLLEFHHALVEKGNGQTNCGICSEVIGEGSISVVVPTHCCSEEICDGCITTLALKIATIRRREAGIPPVGR